MLERSLKMHAKRYLLSSSPDPCCNGLIPIDTFLGTHIKNMATIFVLYERWMNDTEVLRWSSSQFDEKCFG
jgi:hypothetical protein